MSRPTTNSSFLCSFPVPDLVLTIFTLYGIHKVSKSSLNLKCTQSGCVSNPIGMSRKYQFYFKYLKCNFINCCLKCHHIPNIKGLYFKLCFANKRKSFHLIFFLLLRRLSRRLVIGQNVTEKPTTEKLIFYLETQSRNC